MQREAAPATIAVSTSATAGTPPATRRTARLPSPLPPGFIAESRSIRQRWRSPMSPGSPPSLRPSFHTQVGYTFASLRRHRRPGAVQAECGRRHHVGHRRFRRRMPTPPVSATEGCLLLSDVRYSRPSADDPVPLTAHPKSLQSHATACRRWIKSISTARRTPPKHMRNLMLWRFCDRLSMRVAHAC